MVPTTPQSLDNSQTKKYCSSTHWFGITYECQHLSNADSSLIYPGDSTLALPESSLEFAIALCKGKQSTVSPHPLIIFKL